MIVDPNSWTNGGDFLPRECSDFEPDGDLQKTLNIRSMEYASSFNLPLLLTLDSHMVSPERKFIQDVLLQNGNPDGWRFSEVYSMSDLDEVWDTWVGMGLTDYSREFAEAVRNNKTLDEMVENDICLPNRVHLPSVDVPQRIRDQFEDEVDQHLELVLEKIQHHGRIPPRNNEYIQRLDDEIQVIAYNGTINFLPYFLFLEEVCREAREAGDLVGPGRGSAAGSLLSYSLGITHLDPIRYGLSFARFLSMGRIARKKWPDIDLDFGDPGSVAERLKVRLGDKFARICTVGTMKVRNAIRDVSRILLSTKTNPEIAAVVDTVSKSVANVPQGISDTRKWLYGYEDKDGVYHQGEIDRNETLADFFAMYPEVESAVNGVLDVPRSIGRHASAFCVADVGIRDIVPICRVNGEECTQFTKDPVEAMGLVKIDLLGLNTLKDINGAIVWIEKLRGRKIDFYNVPQDCKKTWKAFREADNQTVFQFNTKIGKELSRAVQPNSIEDLAQMTSAGRPGTLDALMPDGKTKLIDQWTDVRRGRKQPSYVHQDVRSILEPTGGICLFQEQISAMFQAVCGYTEEEADEIREIIGKKKKDAMAQRIPEIRNKLLEAGWTEVQRESFISLCEAASNYSFNRSHAVAYSYLGYVCQWLKTNYPLEWWTSILQNSDQDDIKANASYCSDLVSPPDVNRSELDFFIAESGEASGDRGRILYPLRMVKKVKSAAEGIYLERKSEKGDFTSLEDFFERINRTKVNLGVVTQLIWAGAFDRLCGARSILDRNSIFERYMRLRGGLDLTRYVPKTELELMNLQVEALPLWIPDYVSFLNVQVPNARIDPPGIIYNLREKTPVVIGGYVRSRRDLLTKKGDPMCFIELANGVDEVSITCFPELFERQGSLIEGGDVIWVRGNVNHYNGRVGVVADEIFRYRERIPETTRAAIQQTEGPEHEPEEPQEETEIQYSFES